MVRLISGLVLAAAAVAAILFLPPIGLRLLACAVAGVAGDELSRISRSGSRAGAVIVAIASCWLASSAWPIGLVGIVGTVVALTLMTVAAVAAADAWWPGVHARQAAGVMLAAVYVGMPLGMLVAVHAAAGWQATFLLIGTVVVSDSAQYYSGRAFGRRPLAPAISPKKTIEGAIGGVVAGTAFFAVAGTQALPSAPPASLVALGLLTVILGICGDLFESRMKRAAGMKDSSHLIPGHGGVLDRIDALLFTIPPFYLYIRAVT
jgi:phosphatidate cytidylyltransferase